jgi:hypothetical protein
MKLDSREIISRSMTARSSHVGRVHENEFSMATGSRHSQANPPTPRTTHSWRTVPLPDVRELHSSAVDSVYLFHLMLVNLIH